MFVQVTVSNYVLTGSLCFFETDFVRLDLERSSEYLEWRDPHHLIALPFFSRSEEKINQKVRLVMEKIGRERPSWLLESGLKFTKLCKFIFEKSKYIRYQIQTSEVYGKQVRQPLSAIQLRKQVHPRMKMTDPKRRQIRFSIAKLEFQKISAS